jgi:hypothetical protein
VAREAYTVKEFCAAFRISEDMFWKMRRAGWAPALMKVGSKVLISTAAAEQWKREREAAGAREPARHSQPQSLDQRKPRIGGVD